MGEDKDDLPPLGDDEPEEPKAAKARAKPTGSPKGSHVDQAKAKVTKLGGSLFTATSPNACTEAYFWVWQAIAWAAGSEEELYTSDPDIEAGGEALHRVNAQYPVTRALVNLTPPIVLIGATAHVGRRVFANCPPGTLGYRWTHRREQAPEQEFIPHVVPDDYPQVG